MGECVTAATTTSGLSVRVGVAAVDVLDGGSGTDIWMLELDAEHAGRTLEYYVRRSGHCDGFVFE